MNSIVQNPSSNTYFEAYMIPSSEGSKRKKVYIYLTTKVKLTIA